MYYPEIIYVFVYVAFNAFMICISNLGWITMIITVIITVSAAGPEMGKKEAQTTQITKG